MQLKHLISIGFVLFLSASCRIWGNMDQDPYLWLEEVEGEKALSWVKKQNQESLGILEKDSLFSQYKQKAEVLLNDKEKIPYVGLRGGYAYNFWQDATHVRGVWRRTTLKEYLKKEPKWDVLIDLDVLAKAENENWVYGGVSCLPPRYDRCLVTLSRGGSDAAVVREFDIPTRQFVQDGFYLKEAKSDVSWVDQDTVVFGTHMGDDSLTESGYPRKAYLWKRGQKIEAAREIFSGEKTDVSAGYYRSVRPEGSVGIFYRSTSFFTREYWLADDQFKTVKIPVPDSFQHRLSFHGQEIFLLRKDWRGAKSGSVIAITDAEIRQPNQTEAGLKFEILYTPDDKTSVESVVGTKDHIILSLLSNVVGKVLRLRRDSNGKWASQPVELPQTGAVGIAALRDDSEEVMYTYQDFLSPEKLYYQPDEKRRPAVIKKRESKFKADGLMIEQLEAKSADGTSVPYFVVRKKDMKFDGKNPTLLYGYGGFEVALTPSYSAVRGQLWLESGGVYVLANIRGGGEFGPKWHQAALKKNRQRAFDDFIGIAEDLIARKVTSPRHLGIMGGSNGGLLVGATMVQRPELFNAVVCQVPLLDMLRYTKLLAGASWVGEYGDPEDPEMRPTIEAYSPYQNLDADQKNYPEAFFLTSTKDDRVHPGHARKMVARMKEFGNRVLYYENMEGGHGAGANLLQHAHRYALEYIYLRQKLF